MWRCASGGQGASAMAKTRRETRQKNSRIEVWFPDCPIEVVENLVGCAGLPHASSRDSYG
jgi:hypothetical protein